MLEKFRLVRNLAAVAGSVLMIATVFAPPSCLSADDGRAPALVLVVMDPLSAPLACDCVQGYAQRKYEKLGLFLAKRLQREVKIVWAESLQAAVRETGGQADIVIGKHSVALANAADLELDMQPVASLTDKQGSINQSGLIVVRKDDQAKAVSDLQGYRVMFGPRECDEKYAAPLAALREAKIDVPEKPETFAACSLAATKLLELPAAEKAAAVISSYAAPLLEGCGTIKQGDLRVIGETSPVRFISVFVDNKLDEQLRGEISRALMGVGEEADLLIALETDTGFVEYTEPTSNPDASGAGAAQSAATYEQKKN